MKRLRNFLRLSQTDQNLLITSTLLLAAITLGLRVVPFQRLWRLISSLAQQPAGIPQARQVPAERIAWAVRKASRYIPTATCLPQALVGQILLKRRGYPTLLRIGVTKNGEGQLEAHAWVESHEKIIIGGLPDLVRFTPLPPLEVRQIERYRWHILS